MNYDLVSKIVCPCALAYLVMIDGKRFFLYLSVFSSIPFNISQTMFLTISRWLLENVVEEEAEDANQQNDSKCCESRLVIQFQG